MQTNSYRAKSSATRFEEPNKTLLDDSTKANKLAGMSYRQQVKFIMQRT